MGLFDSIGTVVGAVNPVGLFGTAASMGDSVLSYIGQDRANKANRDLSREQMAFQERMSSTAHQREVQDLRKAGLNPILSAGGSGASSPGGSMATMENVFENVKPFTSGLDTLRTVSELSNLVASTEKTRADINLVNTEKAIKEHELSTAQLDALKAKGKMPLYDLLYKLINALLGNAVNEKSGSNKGDFGGYGGDIPDSIYLGTGK